MNKKDTNAIAIGLKLGIHIAIEPDKFDSNSFWFIFKKWNPYKLEMVELKERRTMQEINGLINALEKAIASFVIMGLIKGN
jgi:hypothetical protein